MRSCFVEFRKYTIMAAVVISFGFAAPEVASACTATIGNFVWLDLNRNGVQDPDEPGIEGVRIDLVSTVDGSIIMTTSTNASGFYSFLGRWCEQTLEVRAAVPAGLLPTLIGVGGGAVDSNDPFGALVGPLTDFPEWDSSVIDETIDFGFVAPIVCSASIGNFVWNDLNNNGVQDPGEPGIAGNVVTLSGAASASTTTDAIGGYGFGNRCAGTYLVCAGVPMGFQAGLTDVGSDALDSDGVANNDNSCVSVTISNNAADDSIDFGFWKVPTTSDPGTGTPGFWKNHPEAWPVGEITIGGVVYTKSQALVVLGKADGGDKSMTMFRHLVSAKLNVLIGNTATCVAGTISAADAWMATNGPAGSRVGAKTQAWRVGEPLSQELDAYNNGDRCAPHRN